MSSLRPAFDYVKANNLADPWEDTIREFYAQVTGDRNHRSPDYMIATDRLTFGYFMALVSPAHHEQVLALLAQGEAEQRARIAARSATRATDAASRAANTADLLAAITGKQKRPPAT